MGVFCLAVLSENLQDVGSMFMIKEKFYNFRLSLIIINVQPLVIGLCTLQCVYPLSGSVRGTLLHNQESLNFLLEVIIKLEILNFKSLLS